MAKEIEKIGYIVKPDPDEPGRNAHWKSDVPDDEADAIEKATEAVAKLFEAVRTENPGEIELLRIGGLRKRC